MQFKVDKIRKFAAIIAIILLCAGLLLEHIVDHRQLQKQHQKVIHALEVCSHHLAESDLRCRASLLNMEIAR